MLHAHYFGRAETLFQLYMAATSANLTLLVAKVGMTGKTGAGSGDSYEVTCTRLVPPAILVLQGQVEEIHSYDHAQVAALGRP